MAASKPSASASSSVRWPSAASPSAKASTSSSIMLAAHLLQWFFTQCWHGAPVDDVTHIEQSLMLQ
eukprot:11316015-Heterocapsa_arctica.AAC.1